MNFIQTSQLMYLSVTALLGVCAGAPPAIHIPLHKPPSLILKKQPDVAIVLGAGGARGFAHAGAMYVLQKAGIPIDLIVGSSVGSFYGALLADSGNAKKAGRIMMSARFWDIADLANAPSIMGPIQGYHYEKFLLSHMRARQFNQLKIPLIVVATNLKTGNEFVISSGPIAPAAEASSAIPGVVQPAHLYGTTLIDGGITDPVPVDIANRYHPKVIIAINISQSLSHKLPHSAMGVYDRGVQIAWLTLSRLSENKDQDIIIHPDVRESGSFDTTEKYFLFYQGERAAYRALPLIKKILNQKHIMLIPHPFSVSTHTNKSEKSVPKK